MDQIVNDNITFNVNYSYQKDPEARDNLTPPQEFGFPPKTASTSG